MGTRRMLAALGAAVALTAVAMTAPTTATAGGELDAGQVVLAAGPNLQNVVGTVTAPGDTGLRNYVIVSARNDSSYVSTFFHNADCTGARISKAPHSDIVNFPFRPLCVRLA
ncbi:MAG: hypothetical protein ACRD0P_05895 [Stackebrandtia sp.]